MQNTYRMTQELEYCEYCKGLMSGIGIDLTPGVFHRDCVDEVVSRVMALNSDKEG